ncbi:uncharacterized protein LOC128759371 [Synchiropus splendidus]|uniref:uncharacterized protein LOC128759371 n=1 Tax=Synchiropus splendidus TaxID=270530 RepID=UPI00237DAFA2|nr:uncharacterized protein LOC128759371 [Synchiropus splendidus]
MKSFERLVLSHLKSITASHLDSLQFAYRANRSVDDAVNQALHFIPQHLDSPGTYAKFLFVDFSSAFNTILPALLEDKLRQLNVPYRLPDQPDPASVAGDDCLRHSDPQHRVSSGLCSLSMALLCCTSSHQSVKLIKFADDNTIIRLISYGDESAYRREPPSLRTNHQVPCQEGPAESALFEAATKTTITDKVAGGILHGHHPVHPHLLYDRLVQQRHLFRTCMSPGPRDVQFGLEPTFLILDMDCLSLFPLAGGYGQSRPEPSVTGTASSPLPPDCRICDQPLLFILFYFIFCLHFIPEYFPSWWDSH